MICRQCGNELREGKNFCPKCGMKVESGKNEDIDKKVNEEVSSTIDSTSLTVKNNRKVNKKIALISVTSIVALFLIILFINIFANNTPDVTKIKKDLVGQSIKISDNDSWNIAENDIKDLKITSHSSQLNNNVCNVIFDLSLQSNTAIVTGKVSAVYKLDKKNWVLQQIERVKDDDFKYNFIKGLEPSFDAEKIKKDLVGQAIVLSNKQTYTIKKEELKDLKISSKVASNKGEIENISVSVSIQNNIMSINGNLNFNCSFIQGQGWGLNKQNVKQNDIKVNYVLTSEDKIKTDLIGKKFLAKPSKGNYWGTWTIGKGELLDFKITNREKFDKTDIIHADVILKETENNHLVKGPIKIIYILSDSGWQLSSVSNDTNSDLYTEGW